MTLILIFTDPATPTIEAPTVTTQAVSSIAQTSATGNGTILDTGGANATKRGVQLNTSTTPPLSGPPGHDFNEVGNFGAGVFTISITGLTPGQTYYYRAYAINSAGTGYGSWVSFTASSATYNITIDDIDRTADIVQGSLQIEDVINDKQNTCRFKLVDRSGHGIPANDEEIVINMNDGTKLFGGYVVDVSLSSIKQTGVVFASISCVDYSRLLDRNLVHKTYEDMTDAAIIADIVATYCGGSGITTTHVLTGVTIDQISFNYIQPSQCLRQLADLTGRNWYIDYDKDIHFFPLTTNEAPFDIDSSSNEYINLNIGKDASQIKNRVYVRGGTKLSDFTTYSELGDGEKIKFNLPDKPHDVTVEVDRGAGYVEESVGIKNVDLSGFKWYLNFQEKYLEQDSAEVVLGATDKLKITYKYDIPILVAVENTASILANGVREFAIFDTSITTTQAARERASAELTDYANNIIEGSFETHTNGFISGQYININLSDYGINDDYIVQRVIAKSQGGGKYVYKIYVASSKTMGIIRFLIELLEANKNLITLDDNEVVDELLNLTDSLLSDSLLDSVDIDSAGPYRTWCLDTGETTETRAVWSLFEWGGDS